MIDALITSGLCSPRRPRFSRTRSKTTIVSFSEYPTIMRKAATIGRSILKSFNQNGCVPVHCTIQPARHTMPAAMITSCAKASTAARP